MLDISGNNSTNKYQYDFLPLFVRANTLIWGFLPSGEINYGLFWFLTKRHFNVSWSKQNDNPGDTYEMFYNSSPKQPACPREGLYCWTVAENIRIYLRSLEVQLVRHCSQQDNPVSPWVWASLLTLHFWKFVLIVRSLMVIFFVLKDTLEWSLLPNSPWHRRVLV